MTRARDLSNLIGSCIFSSTSFTATAGQTVFTIAHTQGFVQVFMNGLLLDETVDYTSNGSAITLTSAAVAGDEIEVVKYDTFSVGDAVNASELGTITTTFTNKTINLSNNTLSGTKAQFNTALSDGSFRVGYGAGEVIECLTGACDGRTIVGKSGTYTWPDVTAGQAPSTTFVDITGSSISYTPPSEANHVKYDFNFHFSIGTAGSPFYHFKFIFDNTEVGHGRHTNYAIFEGRIPYTMVLSLNNSTENLSDGLIGTWNSAKTMKLQGRAWSTSFLGELHTTHYYNGGALNSLVLPTLTITAIA